MTVDEAEERAKQLNLGGAHRHDWYYFAAQSLGGCGWYVARRQKETKIHIAVFTDGSLSVYER